MTIRPRSASGAKTAERGPDADARLAAAQAPPLVVALAVGERRVQDGDAVAEPGPEAGHRLRREADLGDEDDRRAAAGERRLDRGEVDLGLARAGDAVQEELAFGAGDAVDRGDDLLGRPLLLGQQLRPLRLGADRAVLGRAPHARAAGRDQPALLEAAQDLAVGADRGGELGRRHLSGAAQRLQRRPLLDPEPLRAAQRRLAGGGDLGPQLDPRADPLTAGPGPRRQHQLEPPRGGRAVLARDPEAEPDQLRRRAGLERLDRLGEALGGQLGALGQLDDDAEHAPVAEGDADDAADLETLHRGPAGGSRTAPAGHGRWSAARPSRSSPAHGMETGGRRCMLPPMAQLNLSPGEQVIFEGHPSWRAILGFYLKGILVAAMVGVDRQALRREQRDRLPDRPRDHRPDRPDRLRQAGRDDLHDHQPPPQHQARDRLARDPGDPPRAGPERQLPAERLPAGHADRRRRLRHRRHRRLQLRLRRGRRPGRRRPQRRPGDRRRPPPAATASARRSPPRAPTHRRYAR